MDLNLELGPNAQMINALYSDGKLSGLSLKHLDVLIMFAKTQIEDYIVDNIEDYIEDYIAGDIEDHISFELPIKEIWKEIGVNDPDETHTALSYQVLGDLFSNGFAFYARDVGKYRWRTYSKWVTSFGVRISFNYASPLISISVTMDASLLKLYYSDQQDFIRACLLGKEMDNWY